MPDEKRKRLQQNFYRTGRWLMMIVMLAATLALAGWQFNLEPLRKPFPRLTSMNPLTAVLLVAAGIAFFQKKLLRPLALIICTAGIIKLLDTAGLSFPIDRLLYPAKLNGGTNDLPSTMAPNTAFCFVMAGAGLLLHPQQSRGSSLLRQWLIVPILITCFFAVLGYLYDVHAFYGMMDYHPMALHTAFCFILLAQALLYAHPNQGIMKLVASPLSGGLTARWLVPPAVLIPVLLGLVRFPLAVLVLSVAIIFLATTFYIAFLLDRRDRHQETFSTALKTEVALKTAELTAIFERITDGFIALDSQFRCTYVNRQTATATGMEPALLTGRNILEVFPDSKNSATHSALQLAMREQRNVMVTDYYGELDVWLENHIYPSPDGLSVFMRDITEGKKATQALMEKDAQIVQERLQEQQKIAHAIITAGETERNRLGQELHDNINQLLASTRIHLSMAAKDKTNKASVAYPMELLDLSIREIRYLSSQLVVPVKDIQLADWIRTLLEQLEAGTGLITDFYYSPAVQVEDHELKLTIYRIIQEQVHNIVKYACAKTVMVSIYPDDDRLLHIVISDDGIGFDTGKKRSGIGLANMKSRAEFFKGTMQLDTAPGKGCTVAVSFPL